MLCTIVLISPERQEPSGCRTFGWNASTVILSPRTAIDAAPDRSRTAGGARTPRAPSRARAPRFHAFGGNTAEAILHLRNERVVFQVQLLRELNLRQSRAGAQFLEPSPRFAAQLLGHGGLTHELNSSRHCQNRLAGSFQTY